MSDDYEDHIRTAERYSQMAQDHASRDPEGAMVYAQIAQAEGQLAQLKMDQIIWADDL